ncbi:MAG TPA: rod shape-determining protein RodA, partial [Bacteroidetes bacterium]|nr:rod shape-determining protein RodA [Bacteroidota bacterium]
FIFSVIGEELGFIGGMVVLILFAVILFRGFRIAANTKNRFAGLLGIGVTTMFLYHVVVNIGMVTGIMPVTGLPLPFISYGGSFVLVSMVAMGVLVNVSMRKYEY